MNGDGIFFSLPYVDPQTGQPVVTPHYDARRWPTIDPIADQAIFTEQWYGDYIVPIEDTTAPPSSRTPEATTQSYESPWYVDSINRAIERAAQVATLEVAGYPPYPSYPTPSPQPQPYPLPVPTPGATPQPQREGIQLSQTTLMLIVGGFLLFTLGKRGR